MNHVKQRLGVDPGNVLEKTARFIVYTILTVWAITILLPIYWMFITAIKPETLVLEIPPHFFPRKIVFDNFKELFHVAEISRWFLNSLIVSGIITIGAVVNDSMAGYSYSLLKPRGYKILFFIILSCLMIPDQIRIVPLFIMLTDLNWINTYTGLIVPFMGSAFGMFLMRQYMRSLPVELIEAAKVEGCNPFSIYTRIVVPLSAPVFAVTTIFFFVGNWNSFMWPLILTSSGEMRTLPVGLSSLQGQYLVNYGVMMAGAAISAIPVMIIFFFFQKFFTKGITLGAVKE